MLASRTGNSAATVGEYDERASRACTLHCGIAMSARLLEQLQSETRAQSCARESQALAFVENCTRDAFRDYLVRSYGFEAPLESACAMAPQVASHSATLRPRTRYIAQDLADLGLPLERLLEVETCPLPLFRDPAQALGWVYVAERNVMTNTLCHRTLASRDPELATHASYLNCYGTATAARWRGFGISFERVAASIDPERIVVSAVESFERLRRWLQLTPA
jgi:heme oxygenase (biliverdin-IX-beta and delta-forming)